MIDLQRNNAKMISTYHLKGIRRAQLASQRRQTNIFLDLRNIWRANTISQQKRYDAIRKSELFSDKRKNTFVKFNFRNYESKDIGYSKIYDKIIGGKNNKDRNIISKGTMNVNELWSEQKLKQLLGFLPFPRDRSKVLKMYSNNRKKLQLSPRLLTE